MDGSITEYAIPKANSNPGGIGLGPDSRMYFTETSGNRLGAVTTDFVPSAGAGGSGPAAGARTGSSPGAGIARLSVRTRWRFAHGRWRLWVRGTLVPARGAAPAQACAGRRVEVRLRRGRRSIAMRRVRATRRCAYTATLGIGGSAARGRGRLYLVVRLPGLTRPRPLTRRIGRPPSRPVRPAR
jgi:hypothetical protein